MSVEREKIILRNLQYDEIYMRKVIPFMKADYFIQDDDKLYYNTLENYFTKYNALPSREAVVLALRAMKGVPVSFITSALTMADDFDRDKATPVNIEWLVNESEEFCQDKALYLAMLESLKIMESSNKDRLARTAIPEILTKANAVSFDSDIGHDYIKGFDERFAFYTQKTSKLRCHLESLNKITNGGFERKTLNCVAAGTNAGKSIFLCDLAANYMKAGLNVLYITLEMSDLKIAQRIDANLMNIDINDIAKTPRLTWDEKAAMVRNQVKGKLVFKEYPTSGANAAHFRFLIRELKQKQNFIPDVIMVDYINICSSVRYKNAAESYGYMKGVTEELRGLMMEHNCVGWTAVQFNRAGINNSDADMTNTGESMGIVHTLDFLLALIVTEDMSKNGSVLFKQLKSRYGDVNTNTKFMVGLDRPKMRFFELTNPGLTNTPPSNTKSAPFRPSNTIAATQPTPTKPLKGVKL
jgi:hypothetical protein